MMFAYVFLLCNTKYVNMTMAAVQSLINTDTTHDIVVLQYSGVHMLPHPKVTLVELKTSARTKGKYQWQCTFDKLQAARLTRYEKVIFLDSDVLVLQNLDELFVSTQGDICAPVAYWLSQPFYMSGGPLVLRTGESAFYDAIDQILPNNYAGEMDYINTLVVEPLPAEYTVLIGNWYASDAVFGRFALGDSKLVHFIANWKPPLSHGLLSKLTTPGRTLYVMWERALYKYTH